MPKDENITTKIKLDISDLKANVSEMNRQIKLANSEFKASASSMDDWTKSTDGLSAKIKQLTSVQESQESILKNLKEQYKQVVEAEGENSKSAESLAIKINNQQSAVNDTGKKLNYYRNELGLVEQAQKNAEKSGKSLEDELADLKSKAEDGTKGWTVMKDVLSDMVSNVISSAIQGFKDLAVESETALDKLQASTGASDKEMKAFDDTLHNLYDNAYGESMDDLATKLGYVKQATGEIDPSKIGDLTKHAITLEDTFGSDFNETIRGVNNMMTHFGISSEEAFDLFAKGSQVGLDYTDELGDNVAEYSGNFAQAGYSAEEYFQLLENGTKGGAYNLDKVNDSINEVKNRLGDGTIEKNLNLFSTNTQTAFNNWKNGKGTMKDVINSIVGDISNCTSETDALTMAQIAFGTMGEDANLEVVKSLNTLGDTFNNVKGTMNDLDTTRYDNLATTFTSLKRTLVDEILQPIVNTLAPPLTSFIRWVIDNMSVLAPIIMGVATAFGILATAMGISALITTVQKAFALLNATMLLNPFVLVATAVVALTVALVALWQKNEGFRDAVKGIWDAITGFFKTAVETIKSVWNAIPSFFSGIWDGIKSVFSSVGSWFKTKFTDAKNQLLSAFSNIKSKFTEILNKIKSVFSVDALKEAGKNLLTGLWNGISNKVGWLKSKVSGVVDKIKGWFTGKNGFDEHSPSKWSKKVGSYVMEGLDNGIGDYKGISVKGAISTMKTGLEKSISAGIGSGGTSSIGGVTYNFNQTINSPKSLSRLEIYRQSKNLLNARGV